MNLLRIPERRAAETWRRDMMVALGLADGGGDGGGSAGLAHGIAGIVGVWPLVLLAKLLALGAAATDWGAPALWQAMALNVGIDAAIALLPRVAALRRRPPHRSVWLLLPLMAASGAAIGAWPALLPMPGAAGIALLVVAIGGKQRLFGIAFTAGLGTMLIAAGQTLPPLGLTAVLLALGVVALRLARRDQERMLTLRIGDIKGQRAERLLAEYEASGRGWFWEIDRAARLTYVSPVLAESLGTSADALVGRPIADLIVPGDGGDSDVGGRTLGFHLSSRSAFSEISVRAALAVEERWWSISGHPIVNQFGQFQGFRGSGADLTEIRRSQAEVSRLAQYDSLTGLPNRVQMMRTLEQAIVGSPGRPGECALFLIDLDRFKGVNDTLGHPAGDALLRQVGQRLASALDANGMVGRLGGDEFQIVLPGPADPPALSALAERLIAIVSQPYSIEGSQVVIGASIGIAVSPADGVTTESMIRNADLALYAAKGDGRGIHRFYAASMHANAEDRRQLEQDLRQALVNDGLHLAYQPVVSAATEKITGFEALLRWNHPARGPISPAVFVPIAEDAGLIAHIGEWVLRTACRDAATWPDGVKVAVNVSPIQFASPGLPGIVMSALAAAGLAAQRLELEITESVFLNDDGATDDMFRRLKGLGVRLALDDFGTGYSSLGYLKTAPFDKIKIDQSFVRGAAIKGSRNSAIIKAIVSLAEALDMDTTAEGAETHDELDLIRSLGCSHIQGFIYGRPMLAAEALQRLAGGAAMASGFKAGREPRRTMLRSVGVVHDSHRYSARIRNVSANGALIEGLWHVPAGTRFQIELGQGHIVDAEARWSVEDRTGVEFATSIDLAQVNPAQLDPARPPAPLRRTAAG